MATGPDVWFCLAFAFLLVTTYVLWCVEALPRLRVVLLLVGMVCFVIAIGFHGDLFSAPPTKPAVAPVAQMPG